MRHLLTALLLASAMPVAAQTAMTITPTPDAPIITVQATDTVEAAPDIATVSIGIETTAQTAVEALRLNSARMDKVIAAIRAQGVAARDVRTTNVSVAARYDYRDNKRIFLGYQATNNVSVLLRDIARTGVFLDAMTAAGANQVDGPNFAIDKPEALQVKAADGAAAKLNAEAQAMARRLGFASARLLSVQEGGQFQRGYNEMVVAAARMGGADAAPPPPVMGGTQSVGVSLTGVYQLVR